MSKSRMMGAGGAGSTNYNCNVNLNTAGGNKKQGLPFSLDSPSINHRAIQTSVGNKRDVIFTINQLGGIGHTAKKLRGGVKQRAPYIYLDVQVVPTESETIISISYVDSKNLFTCRRVNGEVRIYTSCPTSLSNITMSNVIYKNRSIFDIVFNHLKKEMGVTTFYNNNDIITDIRSKINGFIESFSDALNGDNQDEIGTYSTLSSNSIGAILYKKNNFNATTSLASFLKRFDVITTKITISFSNDVSQLIIPISFKFV